MSIKGTKREMSSSLWHEAGHVTPVIDKCYPLNEVPDAIRYLEEGHARGKVVITLQHKDRS